MEIKDTKLYNMWRIFLLRGLRYKSSVVSTLTCKTHRRCWTDPRAVDWGPESYESSRVLRLHHFTPKLETPMKCQSVFFCFVFFHYKSPERQWLQQRKQWEETKTHDRCRSTAGAAWHCFSGQKYDEELVKQDRRLFFFFFFLNQVATDSTTCGLKCASFLFSLMSEGSCLALGPNPISFCPTLTVCPFTQAPSGLSVTTSTVRLEAERNRPPSQPLYFSHRWTMGSIKVCLGLQF